jgi:hypothetical protein
MGWSPTAGWSSCRYAEGGEDDNEEGKDVWRTRWYAWNSKCAQSVAMDREVLNLCQYMDVGRGREAYQSKLSPIAKELVLASPEGY